MNHHIGVQNSNSNETAFEDFMLGYWNQMASEIYNGLGDALIDFRNMEGETRFRKLVSEIKAMKSNGRFPNSANIKSAYGDSFWSGYDRILTEDEIMKCPDFLK